jgi:hypothetical protein
MNGRTRMDDSTSEWITYEQAAERLHVSPAAVRARAMRGGWRRQPGIKGVDHRRCKRGKSRGDGKIIRFSRHRESDSLWECRLPQTLTAFRPLI